jgi:hypothetical protein
MARYKQQAFVEEYLLCWNATRAAEKAGYKHPNKQGPRLLVSVGIQEEIRKRLDDLTVSANEVLKKLGEHARGNLGLFFKISERWTDNPFPTEEILEEKKEKMLDADGVAIVSYLYRVRSIVLNMESLLDPKLSHLVKKFMDSPKTGLMIELHDPQAALTLIAKHHKLFAENIDMTLNVEGLDALLDRIYGNHNDQG